ncbi:MAG: hypothetical protein HKN29_16855 [Rhodothermales bacterium]|nr:hypothetical protein [Rhodothermales bacterium]
MKLGSSKDFVLGIAVSYRAVHGVLVKTTDGAGEVIRHFNRPRSANEPMTGPPAGGQEFQYVEEADPDVNFVSGAEVDGSSLFLASEFDASDLQGAGGDMMAPSTIEIELTDILDECAEAGYPDPDVVFCVGSTDLDYHEVLVRTKGRGGDRPAKKSKKAKGKRQDQSKLLQHLAASTDAAFDPDQTVFVPMTPNEERIPRYMAICARPSEIIVPTLRRLAARKRNVSATVIETEVSLLIGLVRRMVADRDAGRTPPTRLVVRVGADDTVILLLEGGNLTHLESLRSITSFDSPDTVCSRILLLQDEQGFSDPDEILVLGEENEEGLTRRLAEFFEDTTVECMRPQLPHSHDDLDEEYSREATLAAAAVVRHMADPAGKVYFEPVTLLPKKLFRRGLRLDGIKWQAVPMLLVLFATVLFFMQRYISQTNEKRALEIKLGEFPTELVEGNKEDLQARIDSIQTATAEYVEALEVLDSILVGSDRWSRAMERTSREASSVPGIWIERWEEVGSTLVLEGTATDRDQVVRYAARMDGEVRTLSFDEIREWPVFKFSLAVRLPRELPEAAQFLRRQATASGE